MDVDIVEGNKSGEDNLQAIRAEEDRSKAEANQGPRWISQLRCQMPGTSR